MKPRITVGVALSLVLAFTLAGAHQDKIRFVITSRTQTDKPGSGEAAGAASALEQFVASALMDRYTCAATLRQRELESMIDHERRRQLLGGEGGDAALAAIAGGAGADYAASLTVIETGGKLSVNGSILDTRTVRKTASDSTNMALDSQALDGLEAFASRFVRSFSGPVCPGDWVGTITARSNDSAQDPKGGSLTSTYELSVQVRGEGARETTVPYKVYEKIVSNPDFRGKQDTMERDGAGNATVGVSSSVYQDTLTITLSKITMVGKHSQPVRLAGQPWKWDVYIENLRIPIPPKADTLTGSRDDSLGRVVEWTLSRAKTASAR